MVKGAAVPPRRAAECLSASRVPRQTSRSAASAWRWASVYERNGPVLILGRRESIRVHYSASGPGSGGAARPAVKRAGSKSERSIEGAPSRIHSAV